ncbi:MAG: hypothetical protein NC311_05460 [Muribaculaceae bacterium]|nr:hypothetical protein [Muribaculaceae bacterium]
MMKKLLSFVCCLLPVGALAGVNYTDATQQTADGYSENAGGNAVTFNPAALNAIGSGGGIGGISTSDISLNVIGNVANALTISGANGLTVTQNLTVGTSASSVGNMGINVGSDSFTINSTGPIEIDGNIVFATDKERSLTLQGNNTTVDVTIGGKTTVNGQFVATSGIGMFESGAIDVTTTGSQDSLDINAATINTGAINVMGGNAKLNATGDITMAQFQMGQNAGNANITAGGNIISGNIQNRAQDMTVTATGNLTSSGNVENSGASMNIKAANIVIDGTMKNDKDATGGISGDGGKLSITTTTGNLTVSGGDANNASLVNSGDLVINVAGNTDFKYGINLSNMAVDKEFHLKTGTLAFGGIDSANLTGAARDAWLQVFANNLNTFYLEITNGAVKANDIINGISGQSGVANNANANMKISGLSVNADTVSNRAKLLQINSTATDGAVNIAGNVSGAQNSETNIVSANNLTVGGTVSNNGTMVFNGKTVNLAGVSNMGDLDILGLTDASGAVHITGTVTNNNDGDLTINARQITIDDTVTNYSGTTTIKGSDSNGSAAQIAGIDVQGGTLNLNALIGGVDVAKGMSVTAGNMNIGGTTTRVDVTESVQINGDVTLSNDLATGNVGNVNIATSGTPVFVLSSGKSINIDGDISATGSDVSRKAQFDSAIVNVGARNTDGSIRTVGNVTAQNLGKIILGGASHATGTADVTGTISASNGGAVEIYSDDTDAGAVDVKNGGLLIAHGSQISADTGAINVVGGVRFVANANTDTESAGLTTDSSDLTMETTSNGQNINISGGVTIGDADTFTLNSAGDATIGGLVNSTGSFIVNALNGIAEFDNNITNTATVEVAAQSINTANINNSGTLKLMANNGTADITTGILINSGSATITGASVNATSIASQGNATNSSVMDIIATSLNSGSITATNGVINLDVANIDASGADIVVNGYLTQGTTTGLMNIVRDNATVSARNLTVTGAFNAVANDVTYSIGDSATITGTTTVSTGASVDLTAKTISMADITNNGALTLSGANEFSAGTVTSTGALSIDSGTGIGTVTSIALNDGTLTLAGAGLTAQGTDNDNQGAFDVSGMIYQKYMGALAANDVNITSDNYVLTVGNIDVAGIKQDAGHLVLNASDVKVDADIDATDLRIAANPDNNWLKVDVGGNILGNTQFIGLESMTVAGNYKFDDNSQINAAIMKYATVADDNTVTVNYWSTVSLNDDDTLGKITNAETDAGALIQVDGAFVSSASGFNVAQNGGALARPQVGLVLDDIVNQGTAIWLLHADGGVSDADLAAKIRNLNVSFCNADGSICFNYLDSLKAENGSDTDLPAYISVRDSDGDGQSDSLYVVFDPRFGGPVEVFKIQPVVGRESDHTTGEYVSAGALDNLIAGKLAETGFYNRTPIEAIPLIFKNTNMSTLANELYDRMEYYNLNRDGAGLARFSRLFQVRELEQLAGSVILNEHTNFRSFEDRMFDEFIWNRNRNLKKAWVDFDYGMFNQKAMDGKRADGNRFSVSGGFDWQESQTLIVGLTGRVSHMSSDNSDSMDLGYLPGQHIAGHVTTKVADTNIGLGAYLMKILGQKTRVYGNGFLDIHLLDVDREQNFVAKISGDGTAFSLTSEWGLLHDWLNQYIVGNMYARVGYNTGFSVTEKAAGQNYMKLESDGYFIFTPGYSLTAQKRIYPSAWFQIRPYATIGVEYDVLGAPDDVKYKFAPAGSFTEYDVDIDPLWANIGGGVEFLSAMGLQFGIDYRYQYNSDIQLHNIRLSGSYRF